MSQPTERLPRTLGLGSATAIVIGITIGSGIFRSPAGVAQKVSDPTAFLSLWVVGGVLALAGALSLAELAALFPESGGYYAYLRETWGRRTAFLFGWTQLVVLRASAIGGIALACGQYSLRMIGVDPVTHALQAQLTAAAAILIASTANIFGARIGAAIVNLSSSAKFLAILALGGAALLLGGDAPPPAAAAAAAVAPVTIGSFGLALVSVLWAYDGFGDVSFAGGEVKNPQRTLPLAIVYGTAGVVVAYVLVNVGYLRVLSAAGVAASPLVAADTMTALVGRTGTVLVSALVALSTFGALNADFLGSTRVFFAMAEDGLFFRAIARVHPRYQTPHVAIILTAALSLVLVFSRSFEALTDTFVIAIWPFYALCVAGLMRLRRSQPDLTRPYRVPGYPFVPLLFLVAAAGFLLNALINDTVATAATFAVILAGLPVYELVFARRAAAR